MATPRNNQRLMISFFGNIFYSHCDIYLYNLGYLTVCESCVEVSRVSFAHGIDVIK